MIPDGFNIRRCPGVIAQNIRLETGLALAPDLGFQVTLTSSEAMARVALISSWWTLLIEGAVAIAFLVPSRKLEGWRDGLLLLFLGTTYFLLPVLGFAYTLAAMGLAQSPKDAKGVRLAYIGMLGLLQFSRLL